MGRAGAIRNEGQTAADAAALAAAQAHRDQLRTALLRSVLDGGDWADLLQGRGPGAPAACAEAARFADRNGADLTGAGCLPGHLPTSFTVTVRTRDTVGRSVIPGTEDRHARATARAVVEPRCVPDPVAVPPSPGPRTGPHRVPPLAHPAAGTAPPGTGTRTRPGRGAAGGRGRGRGRGQGRVRRGRGGGRSAWEPRRETATGARLRRGAPGDRPRAPRALPRGEGPVLGAPRRPMKDARATSEGLP
nr:hypothetical protein [Streptomyces pactum]